MLSKREYIVFDNKLLEAGVTQLRRKRNRKITPAESGSLWNTTATYVPTVIMHAEFNKVSILFYKVHIIVSPIKNIYFIQLI